MRNPKVDIMNIQKQLLIFNIEAQNVICCHFQVKGSISNKVLMNQLARTIQDWTTQNLKQTDDKVIFFYFLVPALYFFMVFTEIRKLFGFTKTKFKFLYKIITAAM